MKRKKLLDVVKACFVCMLFFAFGVSAYGAEAKIDLEESESVLVLQSYIEVDKDGSNLTPRVMIFDGTRILQEGKDYTLSLKKELWLGAEGEEDSYADVKNEEYDGNEEYAIFVNGIGDYEGENLVYPEYVGTKSIVGDYEVLEDVDSYEEEGYDTYILSYLGKEKEVTIPNVIGRKHIVYDVLAGAFCGCENLEKINVGYMMLRSAMYIDCPKLSQIETSYDGCGEGEYVDVAPGRVSVGKASDKISIVAPGDFYWIVDGDVSGKKITIAEYCKQFGYTYADSTEVFYDGDWTYRIDQANEEAEIVSYKGSESKVVVPEEVTYNDDLYEINSIQANAFDGLTQLNEIDLGNNYLIASLCKDCPNLTLITCKNRDFELYGPIVEGKKPKDGALTLQAYRDVVWDVEVIGEDGFPEDSIMTVEDYCKNNGYTFLPLKSNYSGFRIVSTSMKPAIAGDSANLAVEIYTEGDWYTAEDLNLKDKVTDWKLTESTEKYASINSAGEIVYATNVEEETTIVVQCKLHLSDGQIVNVLSPIVVSPKLSAKKSQVVIKGEGLYTTLVCKVRAYAYDKGFVEQDLPQDTKVTYTIENKEILTVDENGVARATDKAKEGDTTKVRADYVMGDKTYPFVFQVMVKTQQEVPQDLGTKDIYIYGFEGCNMEGKIKSFESLYPSLRGKIRYVEVSLGSGDEDSDSDDWEEDEDDWDDEDDDWSVYQTALEDAMKTENAPDLILWPATMLSDVLDSKYSVSLDSIGYEDAYYEDAFSYTKVNGRKNGKLYAITTDINPGCFLYRKDVAEKLFGTSNPAEVQKQVGDWTTFLANGPVAFEKGYYMLAGLEVENVAFHSGENSWVERGELDLVQKVVPYLSLERELYLNDCVNEDCYDWDYYQYEPRFPKNCLGYFVDANYIQNEFRMSGYASEYDVCAGPQCYEGELMPYVTVTNQANNNALANLFLKALTTNENVMRLNMENGVGVPNNQKLLAEYKQSPYNAWDQVASEMKGFKYSKYDEELELYIGEEYNLMMWANTVKKATIEGVSIKNLLQQIKQEIELYFDKLEVFYPNTVEWQSVAKEEEKQPDASTEEKDDPIAPVPDTPTPGTPDAGDQNQKPNTQLPSTQKPSLHVHTYGEWSVVVTPMCDMVGVKERVCSSCGNKETTSIPATGYVKDGQFVKSNLIYCITKVKGKKGSVEVTGYIKEKKKITLPKTVKAGGITFSVTAIGNGAFKANKKLKTFTVSKNVTKIGKNAFSGCKKLTSVKIKTTKLKAVGKNAFKGIGKKAKISVPAKKLVKYKKLLKNKGQAKTVKVQ